MRLIRVMFICSGIALSSWALWAQSPMREGRWEVTMQMEMANMPMKMPAMKNVQCVTKEQLSKDPSSGLPSGDPSGGCKVSDYKVDGNKITWKMACSGQNKMTGSGEMTFKADTYDGAMKMTTSQGEMTMKTAGKRLGDCTS